MAFIITFAKWICPFCFYKYLIIIGNLSFILTRSDDGTPGCTKVVLDELPTLIENIGVEEFAELLKENGIMNDLSNMTIFIPSNEAIEDFRHDLEHLNSVDNERNTYNIDDG